ncbi:hypothetical protein [Candidatus Nitrospira neomarina]|uniref:Uncharacterized protein n=1 Tax=Candidatus Nitrospira neomarina TaxID=3020899 RepID=A0AA96GT71_9BACT|nr:hypothetical protein [Candidatus Nitrospira neomarina]WNM63634.1 hypothetical protein PQG83_07730 [Candidatus Nitrospira neomarina]
MMKQTKHMIGIVSAAAVVTLVLGVGTTVVTATEPCGDFGECKALIEINATDGDIGFHFLMDGDDLNSAQINDPNGAKVFEDQAKGPLREQKLTETFAESAEPLCWDAPDAEPDDEIVTLEEFLERWTAGTYVFTGMGDQGEKSRGQTELTYELPAAPGAVMFDGSVITWMAGDDLGNCASNADLDDLVTAGVLPKHPEDVDVDAFEIVLEPDVEDGDPTGSLKFSVRVPGDIAIKAVTVPADYLASLPDDTPVKIEVGAIGGDDNATFSEADGFCVNDTGPGGCD